MDVGLAIGTRRGLDGEPDVGSGIQLSDDVEARGLDDILERAAGIVTGAVLLAAVVVDALARRQRAASGRI